MESSTHHKNVVDIDTGSLGELLLWLRGTVSGDSSKGISMKERGYLGG